MPPSRLIRLANQLEELFALAGIVNAVQRQQIPDIALLESGSPEFQATDLGMGSTDVFTRGFPRNTAEFPQLP